MSVKYIKQITKHIMYAKYNWIFHVAKNNVPINFVLLSTTIIIIARHEFFRSYLCLTRQASNWDQIHTESASIETKIPLQRGSNNSPDA
jgi:hypothetical protein